MATRGCHLPGSGKFPSISELPPGHSVRTAPPRGEMKRKEGQGCNGSGARGWKEKGQ